MADHDESEECACIGQNDVVLRELRIVEIMSEEDGEIYKVDLSHDGSGNELAMDGYLLLAEWAKSIAMAPLIADMVHSFMQQDDEE